VNYLWQQFLEEQFPGRTPATEKSPSRLNIKNTAIKLLLDQTLSASFFTAIYLAFMKGIAGQPYDVVVEGVRSEFWPLLVASWKVWPLVALLCFTIIPVERRVLFASAVGFGWGIFLSLQG
jgi:protein Mpv17